MKKIRFLFCAIIISFVCFSQVEAATLHAIIVADVEDPWIGESVLVDACNMTRHVREVAYHTGLDLKLCVLKEGRFTANRVWTEIHALEADADDVLLFYYAGHGYRDGSKSSRWPVMFFDEFQGCLDLNTVALALNAKEARFSLAIADCCNNVIYNAPWYKGLAWPKHEGEEIIAENYRRLYLETSGTLLASGCSVGEFSAGVNDTGGFFTYALIEEFRSAVRLPEEPSWEGIFSAAAREVSRVNRQQHPQFGYLEQEFSTQ